MKEKKKLIIGILSVLIVVMAVGYALLAQELTINGRASIDSTWKVEITNITQKELVGGTVEKNKSYNATTANFDVEFSQPGDSITYDIEVTNKGTLDAVITNINVITTNDQEIKYVTSGLKKGDKLLKNGGKNYLTIKIECDPNIKTHPTDTVNEITVQIYSEQNVGQIKVYNEYSIGDMISFSGSNWYVINNSSYLEDYVTVMKETILTNEELGEYAYGDGYNTMEYTWTDDCHNANHGYSSYNPSNCYNVDVNYSSSKIKEYLEGTYINTINSSKLKEIDGYKIRLITIKELEDQLGYQKSSTTNRYSCTIDVTPKFTYENFGNAYGYWTMTSDESNNSSLWYIYQGSDGYQGSSANIKSNYGVRPVINILKDEVE